MICSRLACTTVAALLTFGAMAQFPQREQLPEGSAALVTNINRNSYPRILKDNSLMFRLMAPDAKLVQVDICGKKYDMTRNDRGQWSGTIPAQVPGFHYYSLVVDGVSVNDPASETFYGCGKMMSGIDIPEAGTDLFEVQDVPHGEVRQINYFSKVDNEWRPLFVYTPAGYNEGTDRYPVVYIQHGGGEDHRGWVQQGRMANILDNLIANGKAVPMIVVSANSNIQTRGTGGPAYSQQGMQPFRTEMVENIVPFVDKTYRTKAEPKYRAMCGLSMGGGQSFYVGLLSPDVFANIGIFSTGMFGGISGAANFDLEKECPGILSDTKTFNSKHNVFYISCGEQDPRIEYNKAVVEKMKQGGVNVQFNSFPGDHEWQPWRKSLADFAQKLFKD